MIFTASRRRWFGMLATSSGFVAAGLLLVLTGESAVVGWLGIVLFGACLVVSVWQLVAPSRLVVSDDTIEVRHLGRRWSRDPARSGPFEVWRSTIARQTLVVFDHPDDAARGINRLNRGRSGHSSWLPDTYSMPAAELARLLNEARARALHRSSTAAP